MKNINKQPGNYLWKLKTWSFFSVGFMYNGVFYECYCTIFIDMFFQNGAEWFDGNNPRSNRPVPPHELPEQILVCWRLPLTGLHVSPICRSFVMTFLYLTWVPVPHALEHSDHLPYLDQISHNPLSLSSIRRERCIIHMHDIIFVSWYSQFFDIMESVDDAFLCLWFCEVKSNGFWHRGEKGRKNLSLVYDL